MNDSLKSVSLPTFGWWQTDICGQDSYLVDREVWISGCVGMQLPFKYIISSFILNWQNTVLHSTKALSSFSKNNLNIGKDFVVQAKKSTNGKEYYRIRINEKIKPVKIQMNPALYWPGAPNARCRISEIKFYAYDSLADETNALFVDDLHVELA